MKISSKTLFLIIFVFITLAILLPLNAKAATLYPSPSVGTFNTGQTFSVGVYVSSADQAMNAASGTLSFSADKLEILSISKNNSIFSFWVQEPSYSNSTGTINLEGIVLNPGFKGALGKLLTVNFKAKAKGIATITFSNGSVLANDGVGTSILTGMGSAQFAINDSNIVTTTTTHKITTTTTTKQINTTTTTTTSTTIPSFTSTPLLGLSSPSHPDQNKWYSKQDAKFIWNLEPDTMSVRMSVTNDPKSIPTKVYTPAIDKKDILNNEDGIWYFHLQLRNEEEGSSIAHFRFQIDTVPPKPFEIEILDDQTNNPQPTILFNTIDALSGIDYYKIKIDDEDIVVLKPEKDQKKKIEYILPLQNPGKKIITIEAFDKAGNKTIANKTFTIIAIEAPTIDYYPEKLLISSPLLLEGSAIPEAEIKVFIENSKKEIRIEKTHSNEKGKWFYLESNKLQKETYKIWVEALNTNQSRSNPSATVTVKVISPIIGNISNKTFLSLLNILLILILFSAVIYLGTKEYRQKKKDNKKKRMEALMAIEEEENSIYNGFVFLREVMQKQISKLDKEIDLSDREKKSIMSLKRALKIVQNIDKKEPKKTSKK